MGLLRNVLEFVNRIGNWVGVKELSAFVGIEMLKILIWFWI
jgi:hypothetical protein